MDSTTREDKLKSAKAKLKQYRARQAKTASKSSTDSIDTQHRRSLSKRHSRTESLRRTSMTLPGTVAVPIAVVTAAAAESKHSRRPSRHSRQLSIGTRKESMDIMSGLIASGSIVSNPHFLQAGGSPDLLHHLDALSSPSFPFSSPKTPHAFHPEERRESNRFDALEALEGRSPTRPCAASEGMDSPSSYVPNKRASWGSSAASAMAVQGGKGALDLGMLLEEEEEDEEGSFTTKAPSARTSVTARASLDVSPTIKPQRARPASLRLSSQSSLGTAVNAASPLELSAFTPDTANTTPGSSAGFAFKPLRSLSTSQPARDDAFQSTAVPPRRHRTSGLKSLTLTSPSVEHASLPPITPQSGRRRSSVQGSSVSSTSSASVSASASKRRPATGSSLSMKRMSYRSATPDDHPFGRLVMDDEDGSEASHSYSDNSFAAHFQSHDAMKVQLEALQLEAATLRADLASTRHQLDALHSDRAAPDDLSYRLFELEGALEGKSAELLAEADAHKLALDRVAAELADVRERMAEAENERDALREDVDGWRARCAGLEKAVQAERQAKEEERKQSMLARDKVRKLADQLAVRSPGREAEDASLTAAQAKLIGEMRDQIFAMAGALEAEKRAGAARALEVQALQSQLLAREREAEREMASMAMRTHSDSDASMTSSFGKSNTSHNSFANSEATDDTSYTDIRSSSPVSGGKAMLGLSINLGGLNAVAEEEEENTSVSDLEAQTGAALEESDWVDDGDDVPELDFRGTQTSAQASSRSVAHKAGSNASSVVDEPMPATPCRESPVQPLAPALAAQLPPRHVRSDSFIKQWTFPKGSVEPVCIFEPEDHSFFAISAAEPLPPLPLSKEALELPPFFTSDLVIDEEAVRKSIELQQPPKHIRRPSSPRPTSQRFSPMRTSFSSAAGGPPSARSARLSMALSEASQGSFSSASALAKAPSRMSLQGISSLITAYVAPSQATHVMPKMAYAAAGLCAAHTREESIFADDDQALLRPHSTIALPQSRMTSQQQQLLRQAATTTPVKPRTVTKAEQPRPFASPLRFLDFIGSFGLQAEQVLRV